MNQVLQQKRTARTIFARSTEDYAFRKAAVDRISHEAMVRLSGVKPNNNVLEVACGPAFVSLLFAEQADSVVGVDLAQPKKAASLMTERGLDS